MYLMILTALGFFAHGVYKHYKLWCMGKKENRKSNYIKFLGNILSHRNILKESLPGFMHLLIFLGFIILFLATVIIGLEHYLHLEILQGNFYLGYSLLTDFFGLAIIIGIGAAVLRRIVKPVTEADNKPEDFIILVLIAVIVITGFIVEGLRLAILDVNWQNWSPVGKGFSRMFLGFSESAQKHLHLLFWWLHVFIVCVFIALIPGSKLFHLIAASLNQILKNEQSGKVLNSLDLEDENAESFGTGEINDFSWKQLLDLDACTRCGRCQNNCPAYIAEKPLNPKELTQDLKKALFFAGNMSNLSISRHHFFQETASGIEAGGLFNYVSPDEIWSCTTCLACQEVCPIGVEHVQKIIDLRRYMVMTAGKFPKELQTTFRNLDTNGNPWGIGWASRADWTENINIYQSKEPKEDVILYWPGCFGSYDERNKKVTKSFIEILNAAEVKYKILGNQEKCCGDSARRLGNELIFQMLVSENIENIKKMGIKKIVTQCPHCYNTLKNEYPQFGGDYEVVHHTQLIEELIKEGKLSLETNKELKITFHDPCYLGRYNNSYVPVRNLLTRISNLSLLEMDNKMADSFCCGAGGGQMWIEENKGKRISSIRSLEVEKTDAEILCTACPFCLTMLSDSLEEKNMAVLDVAEIINGINK